MEAQFLAVMAVVGMGLAQAAWAAPLQKKVLIIGVDGTRAAALAGAITPTINALKTGGCFSDRAVNQPVTHSAACWTAMFTGVWGDKNGVQDPGNSFDGNRLDLYPDCMKRLRAANSGLSTVAYLRWAPLSNALAGTEFQAFGSDDAITTATCQRLTNANPDVFYTILLDVDSAGHNPGWFTPTYTNEIQKADARIGRMINALTNRVTYTNEDWLVLVLSDHGEHDSTIERSRMTFHLAWGPSAARGTIWPTPSIVDVCATVLTHMGVPIDPAWNLDARVEGLPFPPARYGTNLIFNGDAEFNSGTNGYKPDRGIAWWSDLYSTTTGLYGSNTNFPSSASPGPPNRGINFFLGGTNSLTSISQTIDLSNLAADIDDPGVDYRMSGWFGGKHSKEDCASLTVRFLNSTGAVLATNLIGNVTASERGQVTGLLERTTNGTLAVGTRLVEVLLVARAATSTNDGSADNLSLVLTPRGDLPFAMLVPVRSEAGWQVGAVTTKTNRFYRLCRSTDFLSWTGTTDDVPGNGGTLLLQDTNAPTGQAFYRVEARRP